MVTEMAPRGDVVLVTGGSGFIGSHVVRMLVENGQNVAEVRIFDLQAPPDYVTNNTGFGPIVPVRYIKGDIRDVTALGEAARGVDAVLHVASSLDRGLSDNMKYLHSINVTGTENVIKICLGANIEHLVYTSSAEVLRGFYPRVNITEEQVDAMPIQAISDLVFPAYCLTKKLAEDAVLAANGKRLPNGKMLHTLSLRSCGVYGEGDKTYVTGMLRTGKTFRLMPILGNVDIQMSKVYAGNVAWAHVHALNVMRICSEDVTVAGSICGLAYHITDATSKENSFMWAKPFLESHHVKVLPFAVPLWLVFYFWVMLEAFVYIMSHLVHISLPGNRNELYLVATTSTYDGSRARALLGYTPFYGAKEAFQRSYRYYSKLKL